MGTTLITTTRHRAQGLAARFGKLARLAVVSTTATVAAVAVGVGAAPAPDGVQEQTASLSDAPPTANLAHFAETRDRRVSRTAPRVALQPRATDHEFATALLNVWTEPREAGKRVGLLRWGTKVAVTGQVVGNWAEVLVPSGKQQVVRWVNADYLAERKPKPEKEERQKPTTSSSAPEAEAEAETETDSGPSVGGVCSNGTSVPSGVSPSIVEIHQAVCANWPQITTYGTFRADSGDHGSGRAVDIMISGATGWEIAEFVRANASGFGVSYVIYAQKIWSIDRAGEGWRWMEDRGSATANHYDHVHVSVY